MKKKIKNSVGLVVILCIVASSIIYAKSEKEMKIIHQNTVAYDEDINFPYISGYKDGTFKPEKAVTREELATMLARIITKNRIPEEENRYQDLMEGRFSTNAINYITQLGIMESVSAHVFKPTQMVSIKEFNKVVEKLAPYIKNNEVTLPSGEGILTRVQAVISLNELFNVQCNTCHTYAPFKDITPGSPAYEAILCATRPQEEMS